MFRATYLGVSLLVLRYVGVQLDLVVQMLSLAEEVIDSHCGIMFLGVSRLVQVDCLRPGTVRLQWRNGSSVAQGCASKFARIHDFGRIVNHYINVERENSREVKTRETRPVHARRSVHVTLAWFESSDGEKHQHRQYASMLPVTAQRISSCRGQTYLQHGRFVVGRLLEIGKGLIAVLRSGQQLIHDVGNLYAVLGRNCGLPLVR